MSASTPLAVHVVVPAHDEVELIGACLASVRHAAARLYDRTGVSATITVVADSCTDGTLEVVARHGAEALVIDARCVGRARDAGVRHVLATSTPPDASRTWIAMTDADSEVPPHWLEAQFASAAEGTDLWVGPVCLDPDSVPAHVLREWLARHHLDQLHIHGANLGFTAATFLRAGGFPALAEHEDVAFVQAAFSAGCTWKAGGPAVRTSGRTRGRTVGGFAGYLCLLAAELDRA